MGANADCVVDGKSAVAPGEHPGSKLLGEGALGNQKLEYLGTKSKLKQLRRNRRQHRKGTVYAEYAVGGKITRALSRFR